MKSLDTLRFLRKKKFWIALTSVLVIIIMVFVDLRSNSYDGQNNPMYMQDAEMFVNQYSEDEDYVAEVQKICDRLAPAMKKEDWKNVNQTLSDLYLIQAGNLLMESQNDNASLYYHDYLRGKEDVEKRIIERNLPIVTDEILEDMYVLGMWSNISRTSEFPYYRLQAQYYQELADKNMKALSYGTINSSTIFVQFIRALFPLLPILIVALMGFDSLQEDQDSGVIKVLLTQPIKRSHYLKKKIVLNMKAVMAIFFVPLLFISLCYGAFDHYETINAPVLSNVQGITSLQMKENTLSQIESGKQQGSIGVIGISQYYPVPVNSWSPSPELDYLEMWKFVGLCIIMSALVLSFFVLLNMLFVVLLKHKIIALIVSLVVMFVGMFFVKASNTGVLFALLPFTYMNPVDILTGFSSYSYLNGILVLLVSNVLLYTLTQWLFKKSDILG